MALVAVAALCVPSGCSMLWVNPYITVEQSHLNWVEIHYYNLNRKPIRRIAVYINGAGHVELKKGTSELISNDFAKRNDSDSWTDIRIQRITSEPDHVNDLFQNLVNHGLLDKEKSFRGVKGRSKLNRFIAVKANICNYTYSETVNIFEVDPDLAEQLLDVIREFDNPTL